MRIVFISLLLSAPSLVAGSLRLQQPSESQQHVLGAHDKLERPRWPGPPSSLSRGHGPRPRIGFVALGDSYSAGIGTGVEGPENDCRQGLHAYPQLMAQDLAASQGGPNNTAFQFMSCTGSTTEAILSGGDTSQIDTVNGSLPIDFALLSVGGNDLGFFDVMNSCIFRFYNFYSGTCETALRNSQALLDGDEFGTRLLIVIMELLDKVRWEKKPYFLITVTGYARFFNDRTDECDDMSLGVWWRGPKLKKEVRARMNAMVQDVNRKIANTVAVINARFTSPKVLFVDYDMAFEGHRFCEPNVTEPDYKRNETWFFLVGGEDNARNGKPANHSTGAQPEMLSPRSANLVDPETCLAPAQRSGDWGLLALCYMAMSKAQDPSLRLANGDIVTENSMWYVPTYYGKTFHPRSLGHETIKNKVYETWAKLEE
jgi:hypothetical protein